ncbi:hypothetical protein KCP73_01890 [Salmonella enterica subsp. enterica]|nr:hypothetical protein KCP73_01890 [Salmonella enterica subsp. enterica]
MATLVKIGRRKMQQLLPTALPKIPSPISPDVVVDGQAVHLIDPFSNRPQCARDAPARRSP